MAAKYGSVDSDISTDSSFHVDLGFAEKCINKVNLSPYSYPSKLGGKPAWLRWEDLPSAEALACRNCTKQTVFLCQIYVPMELRLSLGNNNIEPHHRTLFLFCCRSGSCFKDKKCLKVFRSQIVEKKEESVNFNECAEELKKMTMDLENKPSLCNLCGCFGDKQCSTCHKVSYCNKDHQVMDWKYEHKKTCNKDNSSTGRHSQYLYIYYIY